MLKTRSKEDFINSQSGNLKILISWVSDRIKKSNHHFNDIILLNKDELIDMIIDMKPSNIKMITNFTYVFGLYAKYMNNMQALNIITSLDRNEVWDRYKDTGKVITRFISSTEFKDLIFNIDMFEELNSNWYSALMRCIYYGIYSEDLSVIKNLRASDINVSTGLTNLHTDDGENYSIIIPLDLAEDLVKLSHMVTWERKNRFGVMKVNIEGLYYDSCFKIENRSDKGCYRYSYFARIRKISNDYLERSLKPMNLYVSGIMDRIINSLKKDGHDLEYAFINHPRYAYPVIKKELDNSHYTKDVKYFRQMVIGRLEEFDE